MSEARIEGYEAAVRSQLEALRHVGAELWACGLVDEVEVISPESDLFVYGPFATEAEARELARTLSNDPEEAIVFRLRSTASFYRALAEIDPGDPES